MQLKKIFFLYYETFFLSFSYAILFKGMMII